MKMLGIKTKSTWQISVFALLIIVAGFSYGETSRELVQDETRVILAVENMT